MKQALILLIATVGVFVAPGVHGTDHLSFSNTTANVNRTGCGTTKLCVETPEDCDPATNNTCLFTSVNGNAGTAPNGATLNFELSGASLTGDSYVAVALTANASEGTAMVFICLRNNDTFFFRTMQRNNTDGTLSATEINVTDIQNSISDTRIQCEFVVPGLNATARMADTTFVVLLGSGSVNGTDLEPFNVNVTTAALNLIDPTSNVNPAPTNPPLMINRTGCGTAKLCVETPEDCDPATNNACLFTSAKTTSTAPSNSTMVRFELSGASLTGDSYVALALTANPSEGTGMLYVCGRNGTTNGANGMFFFLTVQRNNTNGMLTVVNTTATGIRSSVTDTKIQCVFDLSFNVPRARNAATSFVIQLGTGNVNGSTLGSFTAKVTTPVLNLANPASNLNTTASSVMINRTGCGTTKLCVETPEDCDPATNNTCLFTSVNGSAGVAPNGAMLNFELSGASITGDSYIGVALTANASELRQYNFTQIKGNGEFRHLLRSTKVNDNYNHTASAPSGSNVHVTIEGTGMLYVCGRNGTTNGANGMFFFLTVQRNNTNGMLTVVNTAATGIQSLVTDTKIQCVFALSGVNASRARNAATTFVLQVGTGSVTRGTLGPFTANLTTAPLNLIDPASNINTTPATTAAPATTSGANSALFPHAVPLLLSIFILSVLKTV